MVDASTALIYQTEYEAFAKKSREILWFKGYYDLISLAKRFWKRNDDGRATPMAEEQLSNLIIEGIAHFKTIVVRLEHDHELDLRHIVDFSFLDTFEKNILLSTTTPTTTTASVTANGDSYRGDTNSTATNQLLLAEKPRKDSIELNRYALETIHALLISLGDLHRYFIEFNFNMPKISKDFASNYYFEAFKLNPKMGMAHNQLGTLLAGQNNDLDSIYHYLYSLVCAVPFELSDVNVTKLFQNNADYLGHAKQNNDKIIVRDIVARFVLIVDVFFYNKEINDLNALCHCTLCDFRELFQSADLNASSDMLFKMIAILLFCLAKLQSIGSPKIHHLNAFLVAICSEMVTTCTNKLKEFFGKKSKQNACFQLEYGDVFDRFEQNVRMARDNHKRFVEAKTTNGDVKKDDELHGQPKNGIKLSAPVKKDQLVVDGKMGSLRSDGSERETDGLGESGSGHPRSTGDQKSTSSQAKTKKKPSKLRRRRKRCTPDSDSESNSDYDMDSDFSTDTDTDDDDEDDMNSSYSTDYEVDVEENQTNHIEAAVNSDNDDDILIEEEELVYLNGNGKLSSEEPYTFGEALCNNLNLLKFDSDGGEDLIIEDEQLLPAVNGAMSNGVSNGLSNDHSADDKSKTEPEKLRYKQKYEKPDPNIVIEFMGSEHVVTAVKILFDWLRINNDILVNCFATNPEFIDKIFALINLINIDIFTRKVYFERKFLKSENVRDDLRMLFDTRSSIPLNEDVLLKEFSVLDQSQHSLDWTMPLKLNVTESEVDILRIFKIIDFGFFMCKMKKFHYNFCSRSRKFVREESSAKRRTRKRGRNKKQRRNRQRDRKSNRNGNGGGFIESRDASGQRKTGGSSNEDIDGNERKVFGLKRGYLKNRGNLLESKSIVNGDDKLAGNQPARNDKHEIMGKLWLQHEIETLEKKISKRPLIMTPYLVVDTKSLIYHLPIVKNLVKTKKFVVLIPNAGKTGIESIALNTFLTMNFIYLSIFHSFGRNGRFEENNGTGKKFNSLVGTGIH